MLRKIILSLLVLSIVNVGVSAVEYPRIRVDGEFVEMQDQQPIIVDGRTLVPLRAVMEALGFRIEWNPYPLNRAMLRKSGFEIGVTIGRDTMFVNGSNIPLEVPAQIVNDRTLVPLRAISEATGMRVDWDNDNRIADIFTTSYALTRSSIILTNERITDEQLAEWKAEYRELGGANEFEIEVVRLINVERANYGLQPLEMQENIMMAARFKSQEMVDLGYFAHESPVYGSASAIPLLFGVRLTGENISTGATTPQMVVSDWMNSPGHRTAILRDRTDVVTIGIGRVGSRTTMQTGSR